MHKNVISKNKTVSLITSACAMALVAMACQLTGSASVRAEESFNSRHEITSTEGTTNGLVVRTSDDDRYSREHSHYDYRNDHSERERHQHEHDRSHDYDSRAQHEYIHHEHEEREQRNRYEH